jgi:hypothetical protein
MFSSRLDWSVRPNPIAELVSEKLRGGAQVLDLTESNPTHAGIVYPTEAIVAALADARALRYEPEPCGLPAARAAVAQYYAAARFDVDPRRIIVTASTSEAYAYLFKLLCDPGDEILTPRPSYPLFEYLAGLESVRAVQYPLFYDHGWHLDAGAVRSLVNARTRAIVTVHPNNPTGSFLKAHELAELDAIAAENDLAIISDEVFSDYRFAPDPTRAGVVAEQSDVLAFSLSGLSKVTGLPQMKLAWMVVGGAIAPRSGVLHRLELIADTYLSPGTPVQAAAQSLLGLRHGVQQQIAERLKHNLECLDREIARTAQARRLALEGGWYATLRVPRVLTDEEWVLALLREHEVLVQPGFFYDFDTEAFLVLSLLTATEVFETGLLRLLTLLTERT